MATSRKRATRKSQPQTPPRPRSPRIRMAVDGNERRVVIGPARRTFDVVFSLLCVTVMVGGTGGLVWRTQALIHHAPATLLAVLGGLWLGLFFLGFILSIQVGWRIFGREAIAVRDATLSIEARLLGGRIVHRIPVDRRLMARLEQVAETTRWQRFVYPKFRLVFEHEGEKIGTTSVLTPSEGDAALAMVRRILPT